MAEGKKSFLLYADLVHTVEKLPNEKAGELFKHILNYVNDNNPITEDVLIDIAFEPIKQSLKRDLEKYERIKSRNSLNGSKGGRPKKGNPEEPKKPSGLSGNPEEPKKADSVNGSVSDSDSVSEITKENIDFIYSLYPTKCPIKNTSTGKGSKNKDQIKKAIKEIGFDKLAETIKWYQSDCVNGKVYMKNFTTFLNNIPELPSEADFKKEEVNSFSEANYIIPKGDKFGYSPDVLKQKCLNGEYPKK